MDMCMIELRLGDITTFDGDVVVNAANTALIAGAGVCGAIFASAGREELQQACDLKAPCPTGEARVTPGFHMRAKWIVHAVGPQWMGGGQGEAAALASAYVNALKAAESVKAQSVALPSISTGTYGYPLEAAAQVAMQAVKSYMKEHSTATVAVKSSLRKVYFYLFTQEDFQAYLKAFNDMA